ncbi:MAG: DUF1194 domain-containing protein [Pseudomonadota bacterium]
MRRACRLLATLALTASSFAAVADEPVDLELVLAADVSLSMDLRELSLQREGYAAAIESPEVMEAILSGYSGAIALVFMEWAGTGTQDVTVPWQRIATPGDASRFAAAIREAPLSRARRTSISSALLAAGELFEGNGFTGFRQVIDVSGDGPNNQGKPVLEARTEILARGITINGLPMMLDPMPVDWYNVPDLDAYYRECVIGGFGSFYIPIQSIDEFGEAIRRKMVLEIAGWSPPARPVPAQFAGPTDYDCLAGEKRWMRRMQRFD